MKKETEGDSDLGYASIGLGREKPGQNSEE